MRRRRAVLGDRPRELGRRPVPGRPDLEDVHTGCRDLGEARGVNRRSFARHDREDLPAVQDDRAVPVQPRRRRGGGLAQREGQQREEQTPHRRLDGPL